MEKMAKEENRTSSELLREAWRRNKAEREMDAFSAYGRAKAAELGITEADVIPLIHQLRKEQQESGLVFGGTPRAVLLLALTEHFILCISNPIQAEVKHTLAGEILMEYGSDPPRLRSLLENRRAGFSRHKPWPSSPLTVTTTGSWNVRWMGRPKPSPIDGIRIMTPRKFLDEHT